MWGIGMFFLFIDWAFCMGFLELEDFIIACFSYEILDSRLGDLVLLKRVSFLGLPPLVTPMSSNLNICYCCLTVDLALDILGIWVPNRCVFFSDTEGTKSLDSSLSLNWLSSFRLPTILFMSWNLLVSSIRVLEKLYWLWFFCCWPPDAPRIGGRVDMAVNCILFKNILSCYYWKLGLCFLDRNLPDEELEFWISFGFIVGMSYCFWWSYWLFTFKSLIVGDT